MTNDDFVVDFYKGDFTQKQASVYYDVLYKKINKINLNEIKFDNFYNERYFNYSKIPELKNTLIKGYFQSEKYFDKYFNQIYSLFIDDEIIDKIKQNFFFNNSLSIHVRRGDYLKKPDYHNILPVSYYLNGINYIEYKTNIDKIYVFSDDIKWCKNNLLDNRCIFVESMKDYEELFMMSLCEHNIIANSSFSWWGSYLNLNNDKIVVAPKQWFGFLYNGSWTDIYYKNNVIL